MSEIKPEMLARLPALVVDQNRFMRALLTDALRQIGLQHISGATDAASALRHIRNGRPGVVFCELELPPHSGIQIVRWIRTSPKSPNPKIPVILIASPTRREEVISARDAGITEFLAKPVTLAGVQSRLQAALTRRRQFVKGISYVGPCRRRRRCGYEGPLRRLEDPLTLGDDTQPLHAVLDTDIDALTNLSRRADLRERRHLREFRARCESAAALAREAADHPLTHIAEDLLACIDRSGANGALEVEVVFAHLSLMSRLVEMRDASSMERHQIAEAFRREVGGAPRLATS